MGRLFESRPAVRSRVPLWINLIGPSGTGKTFSALRLATGMAKVYGDGVSVIDTEARRSEHYADLFKFNIVDFKAPFGPLDYLAAIEHCLRQGAKTIVIDSMSHEWEGEGGVLEQHIQEMERMSRERNKPAEKFDQLAWQGPKREHGRMRSRMVQSGANFILCYRAKEKLKVIPNQPPRALGWQPVGPDDLAYESTLSVLLLPGAGGVPSWTPTEDAEKARVRLPNQFKAMFALRKALDEATGEQLAAWAAGGSAPPADGARSAHQATPATSAAPAGPSGPKASPETLAALSQQLTSNGERTQAAQTLWVRKAAGKAIEDLGEEEAQALLARAEHEAAA
jgi:hypothetical protein